MKIGGLLSDSFQTIVIVVIIGIVFLAGLVLSGVIDVDKLGNTGVKAVNLTVWGDLPETAFRNIFKDINAENKDIFSVRYTPTSKSTYEQVFVDALASASGPDILIITQDLLLKHKNKFYIIPFETYPERGFTDTFIDEAKLFVTDEGILAVPFLVDPIVMYYNKDLFAKAGIAVVPKFWDEFAAFSQRLTGIDNNSNVLQSGAALGVYGNVRNAKEIISMFILQAGDSLVAPRTFTLDLGGIVSGKPANSIENALLFFTDFSNPSKLSYSWNRALPDSRDAFLSGRLAMYFGYASEYDGLKKANPHLNFDLAVVPQIKDFSVQATMGRIYSFVVPKTSKNISAALGATFTMSGSANAARFEEYLGLPTVHRSILAKGSLDPVFSIFYKAAIQSRGWLEPDPARVDEIFRDMVESVITNQKAVKEAAATAKTLLGVELKKITK